MLLIELPQLGDIAFHWIVSIHSKLKIFSSDRVMMSLSLSPEWHGIITSKSAWWQQQHCRVWHQILPRTRSLIPDPGHRKYLGHDSGEPGPRQSLSANKRKFLTDCQQILRHRGAGRNILSELDLKNTLHCIDAAIQSSQNISGWFIFPRVK